MQPYIISFVLSIVFWIWVILKYDRFEREPLKLVILIFVIGGLLSCIPAGIFNHLFSVIIGYDFKAGGGYPSGISKSLLFFAFVGLNEEFWKAMVTIWLIRKMVNFNEPADALVYAMTVAFGFSVYENIEYTMNLGLGAFYFRQFTAVPLHVGLAAIWGIGIAKARYLHHNRYLPVIVPYILGAAFLHFVYNFSPQLFDNIAINLLIPCFIAFIVIRFAIKKMIQYAEDGPFSDRLYCRHCNTPNLLIARNCKNCGEKFHFEFYELCPDCNTKVDKECKFCPKCGTQLAGKEGPSENY